VNGADSDRKWSERDTGDGFRSHKGSKLGEKLLEVFE
jgi:hypothetical protein